MVEKPPINYRKQIEYYRSCIINLVHCLYHLSFEIYPLTKDEFRMQSLPRRAADDYINTIYEDAYKIAKWLLEALDIKPIQKSYYERFKQAEKYGIYPKQLSSALIDLENLRHEIGHENEKVNHDLIAYSQIGNVIIAGYATSEIAQAIKEWPRQPRSGLFIVDKLYMDNKVRKWPLYEDHILKICNKFADDGKLISVEIDFDNYASLIQKFSNLLWFSFYY